MPEDIGASHLYIEIPDPEAITKCAYEALQPGFQLYLQLQEEERYIEEIKRQEEEAEGVYIIVDEEERLSNPFLAGEDFIPLDNSDSDDGIIDSLLSSDESEEEDHYLL